MDKDKYRETLKKLFREALNSFSLAIKINPNDYRAYYGKAKIARWASPISGINDLITAIQKAKDSNESEDVLWTCYNLLGELYGDSSVENYREALNAYNEVIKLDPYESW